MPSFLPKVDKRESPPEPEKGSRNVVVTKGKLWRCLRNPPPIQYDLQTDQCCLLRCRKKTAAHIPIPSGLRGGGSFSARSCKGRQTWWRVHTFHNLTRESDEHDRTSWSNLLYRVCGIKCDKQKKLAHVGEKSTRREGDHS